VCACVCVCVRVCVRARARSFECVLWQSCLHAHCACRVCRESERASRRKRERRRASPRASVCTQCGTYMYAPNYRGKMQSCIDTHTRIRSTLTHPRVHGESESMRVCISHWLICGLTHARVHTHEEFEEHMHGERDKPWSEDHRWNERMHCERMHTHAYVRYIFECVRGYMNTFISSLYNCLYVCLYH